MPNCPLCEVELRMQRRALQGRDAEFFDCPQCGSFEISGTALADSSLEECGPEGRAKLSFAVRARGQTNPPVMLTTRSIREWISVIVLPNPAERIDRLLLFLEEAIQEPGQTADLEDRYLKAAVGAVSDANVGWVLASAKSLELIEGRLERDFEGRTEILGATITLKGWYRLEEIRKGGIASRVAFMAMQYGDAELDAVVRTTFTQAANDAGFRLKRLDQDAPAGLIDDRMRVEIRNARFMIADLSHGNKGAYWEAGFAEGLGKPVIYTCRRDVFDDPNRRPHFDTNHHLTVVWDPNDLRSAQSQLTATIRATLPSEAKQGE